MKVGQLKYIDSMQFMNSSLAKLTENLGDKHPLTSRYFKSQGYTDKQISLATRKGIYPYDYIDSQDRFLETELPPIHEFSTTLKGKISLEDYHHAQKVWKTFGCKNLPYEKRSSKNRVIYDQHNCTTSVCNIRSQNETVLYIFRMNL